MVKYDDTDQPVKCSFCGKTQEMVSKLIAGPGVYICNECIELCLSLIHIFSLKGISEIRHFINSFSRWLVLVWTEIRPFISSAPIILFGNPRRR